MRCEFPEHHGSGPDLLLPALGVLAVAGASAGLVLLAHVVVAVLVVLGALAAAGAAYLVVLLRGARGQLWSPAIEPPEAVVARAIEARRELAALPAGRAALTARVVFAGELLTGIDKAPREIFEAAWARSIPPAAGQGSNTERSE
jgi:hypothetical protein